MTNEQMARRIAYLEDAIRAQVASGHISEREELGDCLCLSCGNGADNWDEIDHYADCAYLEEVADLLNGDMA